MFILRFRRSRGKPPTYVLPELVENDGFAAKLRRRASRLLNSVGQSLVRRGLPPRLLMSRYRRSLPAHAAAMEAETVHEQVQMPTALCGGVRRAEDLSADPGWWGFSLRDVPQRVVAPTRILTVADARVLAMRGGPDHAFTPAVLNADGCSLTMREIRHRPFHWALAQRSPDLRLDRALWIAERVFDNYSHWFSAHWPRLAMLRDQGRLEDLVLPAGRPAWLDDSLRLLGIEQGDFRELPVPGVLEARRLVLVECDRFRPELLQAAQRALPGGTAAQDGRVFISRRDARGRALLEEAELEPLLTQFGFELVAMERLSLREQIALMARTEVLLAPHGAGLTNMLFCPAGTRIGEIADPAYPNPNFYAMAAALGHRFHYIAARGVGDRHPLRQDLSVNVADVRAFLETLP